MGRKLAAVFFGTVAGIVVILFWQLYINSLFPLPAGIKPDDTEAIKQILLNMPVNAFLLLLLAYATGSFVAGLVAALISKESKIQLALINGSILLVMGIVNLIRVPHPLWFIILSVLLYLPCSYLGAKVRK